MTPTVVGAEVFHPSHRQSAFAAALVGLLRERGFAARPVPLGGARGEMLHTVRKTQPGTALVVVEFAPGDYKLVDLILAVLRWKLQGRRVVLCREESATLSPRRRFALRVLRALVDRDIVARDAPVIAGLLFGPDAPVRPPASVRRVASGLDELVPLLACPECRGPLTRDGATLLCRRCGRTHQIVDGIPILLRRDVRIQVEEHEAEYVPGDAYRLGASENRGWLEIGLYKRDVVAGLLRARMPRASIDVGCGDWGVHYDIAGALGSELSIAGDVSLKFVQQARSQATSTGRVHHVVFSADALPFRDGLFDLVYCSEVLEHLERPETALAEMRRVAPDGRAILTVPNEELVGKLEPGHVQTFGFDDFLQLLYRDIAVQDVRGIFLYLEHDPNALARSAFGRARLGAYLRLGERLPRRSMLLVVDGRIRAAKV